MTSPRYLGLDSIVLAALLLSGPAIAEEQEEPEYPHGEFSDDCENCHTSEGWTGGEVAARFDHAEIGFPLTGTHALADCRACHGTLEFSLADGTCVSCHLDVHRAELGTDCNRCHTSRSFIDRTGMARAHLSTRFPLRGAHRVTDCNDCHPPVAQGALQYVNTSVECDACHLDDYLATTDPDHQAETFPQTCELCHGDHGWSPARFDHGSLAPGTACASCHLEDYQVTADPDHQAAGFSQACETCHSTRRWVPTAFDGLNHDGAFFPIYSGKHKGKWNLCSDCHLVPNNFSQFSCIDCHEHDNPNELANKHDGVSGFAYDSQACYGCHPQGRE